LKKYDLPVVEHLYCKTSTQQFESNNSNNHVIKEFDDYISIGKKILKKPFFEKPVKTDDHNIRVYYPLKNGGGCKILKKKNNHFVCKYKKNINQIRKDRNYIYERFLPHDGFDIHVNTIGLDYFHAEALKSPTMDTNEFQEIKKKPKLSFPVNLTLKEKLLCRKIVLIFGQLNCQIDIIRSRGVSYICDINGFSLLKNKKKYLNDFTFILRKKIYDRFFPFSSLATDQDILNNPINNEFHNFRPKESKKTLSSEIGSQLFSIKNKLNSKNSSKASFRKRVNSVTKIKESRFKPKRAKSQKIIENKKTELMSKDSFDEEFDYKEFNDIESLKLKKMNPKKEELRSVIAIFLHQDRSPKQKMKMITSHPKFLELFKKRKKKKEIKIKSPSKLKKIISISMQILEELENLKETPELKIRKNNLNQIIRVLQFGRRINGINRKVQLKPLKVHKNPETKKYKVKKILFVLKWGGSITHSGMKQAERFGKFFRKNFYINENEGLLRLHATYRHDLKIYSADEGRCQLTAAALTKGLIMIEDNLTPILSSFVNSDKNTSKMLDVTKKQGNRRKSSINQNLSKYHKFSNSKIKSEDSTEDVKQFVFSSEDIQYKKKLSEFFKILKEFCYLSKQILESKDMTKDVKISKNLKLCNSENPEFYLKRWFKLLEEFYCPETDSYDSSKLTNILDFIR
jgi:inositol hexakisphosphate/diphosphoinositol-pentakisphosphate kinase